jgi:hypothetical protein
MPSGGIPSTPLQLLELETATAGAASASPETERKQHGGCAFGAPNGAGSPRAMAASPAANGAARAASVKAGEQEAAAAGPPGALTPAEVLHELLGPLYVDASLLSMGARV